MVAELVQQAAPVNGNTQQAAPKNITTSEEVVQAAWQLKTHGWAVIENVIPEDECNAYIQRVWDWLESLGTGIKRDDPSTWSNDRWAPQWGKSGIINTLEVPHQDFVWRMRSDPRITSVFAALWGTDALLSSFDSINVMRPPSITNPGAPPGDQNHQAWWHTDQAPSKSGVRCIQGLLNLTPCGPNAGTLAVKEGTHMQHEAYWAAHPMSDADKAAVGDFYLFKPDEVGHWEQFKTVVLRGYGPGSIFLWDSRTVHQNCPPSSPDLWRQVLYTCYQPAAMASEGDLAKKREAYEQYRVTTHWPAASVCIGAGPSEEHLEKYNLPRTRHLVEDDTILKLAGMQPYNPMQERRCKPLLEASLQELETLLRDVHGRKVAVVEAANAQITEHNARVAALQPHTPEQLSPQRE